MSIWSYELWKYIFRKLRNRQLHENKTDKEEPSSDVNEDFILLHLKGSKAGTYPSVISQT